MELLRPAVLCWNAVTVWEFIGWGHGRTPCARTSPPLLLTIASTLRSGLGGMDTLTTLPS